MPYVESGYCCVFEECLEMTRSLIQTPHTAQSEPFPTPGEPVTNFKQFHMLQSQLGSSAKMLLIWYLEIEKHSITQGACRIGKGQIQLLNKWLYWIWSL